MNNTYEVGVTPDDNNDIRLPGTCNPEPQRGDSAYGPGKWKTIYPTNLDVADTAGIVGIPTMQDNFGMEGTLAPSLNANVDVHNSDTTLMAPVGDSETNLSRKYKYPNVHQDIPPKGQPSVQYNDHT